MVLVSCDQCHTTYTQGQHAWVVVGHVLTEADAANLDLDDEPPDSLHFCGWQCAATYTGARALVDS